MLLTGGKNSRMRMKVQGLLMQARFVEIHQVFSKKKKLGYFSNTPRLGTELRIVPLEHCVVRVVPGCHGTVKLLQSVDLGWRWNNVFGAAAPTRTMFDLLPGRCDVSYHFWQSRAHVDNLAIHSSKLSPAFLNCQFHTPLTNLKVFEGSMPS